MFIYIHTCKLIYVKYIYIYKLRWHKKATNADTYTQIYIYIYIYIYPKMISRIENMYLQNH